MSILLASVAVKLKYFPFKSEKKFLIPPNIEYSIVLFTGSIFPIEGNIWSLRSLTGSNQAHLLKAGFISKSLLLTKKES